MPYTLWSREQLLGETDFEFYKGSGPRRAGVFRPTPLGVTLLPTLTGIGPALLGFGQLFTSETSQHGEDADLELALEDAIARDMAEIRHHASRVCDGSDDELDDDLRQFDDSELDEFDGADLDFEIEELDAEDEVSDAQADAFMGLLHDSGPGAAVLSFAKQLAALELELRDPEGAVVRTRSIAVHDMYQLLDFAQSPGDLELRFATANEAQDRPRYYLSATLAARPKSSIFPRH
jgi:hypothetical protein